jgi:hypothetical protein
LLVQSLLVEGKLDSEIMAALLAGRPLVDKGGSKTSLRPYAFNYAKFKRETVGFLRDRDFDFDPPEDLSRPVEELSGRGKVWGWHWCRHSIENYLLEPALVVEADPAILQREYETQLGSAARIIRYYQAARWAMGLARRDLPPRHQLQTYPEDAEDGEFVLPEDCSEEYVREWVLQQTTQHLETFVKALDKRTVESNYSAYASRFNDDFCNDVKSILVWFSGKNLLGAMGEWLTSTGRYANPGDFRVILRDWVRSHREATLEIIPEWRSLVDLLGCK